MGYLTAAGIEASVQYLAATYPAFCQAIVLPETSVEGRTSRALKIASGAGERRGVLFLGGVHAREIVNPDLLVSFAVDLCQAYAGGTGLTFGPKSYSSATVKLIVEALDVFVFPLVNPDGREYVQAPGGDVWWRKNRRFDPASGCYGVDLNRNFDLLWSSGIGTSSNPCDYQIYKGPSLFSEPETRNARWLVDTYPHIEGMIDIHSYSDDLLYPWGDADDQTTDPSKNFQNPAYDGLRGVSGSAVYGEYIPQPDLDWFTATGNAVQAAIQAVRGTAYTVKQSIGLYPTSGTSDDYSYSRHFVDGTRSRVYAYTLETGTEFQPPYSEAVNIITEVSSGLIQFCLECLCTVTEVARGTGLMDRLDALRAFRDQIMLTTTAGAGFAASLGRHNAELAELLAADPAMRDRAADLLAAVETAASHDTALDADLVGRAQLLAGELAERGSPELRDTLAAIVTGAEQFTGRTILDGLRAVAS
jgi:murein tripeptide amidase MpaA